MQTQKEVVRSLIQAFAPNLSLERIEAEAALICQKLEAARAGDSSFEAFSRANRARCEAADGFHHPLGSWSTSDWMVAALGELGEAANIVKKLNRVRDGVRGNKQTPEELQAKLRQEIGDTFVYLDLLAQSLGFSLLHAGVEVFNAKSKEIGYPHQL